MNKYYINGANITGEFPYTEWDKGAPNFLTLLDDVTLVAGDEIRVLFGSNYISDNSDNTIEINTPVKIIGYEIQSGIASKLSDKYSKMIVKNDDVGLSITCDNVTIENIEFNRTVSSQFNSLINVSGSNNLNINKCRFVDEISIEDSNFVKINQCEIPSDYSGKISITNSDKVDISNNIIKITGDYTAIFCNSNDNNSGLNIYDNLIYADISSSSLNGITVQTEYNGINIYRNVIRYFGENSHGIKFEGTDRNNIKIKNNVIICDDNKIGSSGIIVEDNKIEITNNIIYNNSGLTDGVSSDIPVSDDIIFDYNWIYNWDESHDKTFTVTDIDPLIKIIQDSSLDERNIENYMVEEESRCFGTGIYYENVGINKNDSDIYSSIIDTFYDVPNIDNISNINFIGCVFNDDVDSVNNRYNKSYEIDDDYYENQFDWGSEEIQDDEDFPFWKGNDFYGEDMYYVIKNRKELQPFESIWCPANPGYGYPDYTDYETGLFGYPRIDYINNCNECIIQDDYITDDIWEDDVESDTIIEDQINPPCIE
ncbi:MAG: hypothetical protein ACOCZ5_00260 [bacterium]